MPKPAIDIKFKPLLIKIRLNVAYYRNLKNITQMELAELTNLSRRTISCIEAPDKYYGMAINSLFKIAKALNVPVKKFFDFRDEQD